MIFFVATLVSVEQASAQTEFASQITIFGEVKDENGDAVEDAKIWFEVNRDRVIKDESGRDGRFQLRFDSNGMHQSYNGLGLIWIYAPGYDVATASVYPALLGEMHMADVVLKNASEMTTTVLDPAGNPIRNARIRPWHVTTVPRTATTFMPEPVLEALEVKTDAQGAAVLKSFPPSQLVSLTVKTDKFGAQHHAVSNLDRSNRSMQIELQPVGKLRIKFVGNPKAQKGSATAYLWPRGQEEAYSSPVTKLRFSESVEIDKLVRGKYRFWLNVDGDPDFLPDIDDFVNIHEDDTAEYQFELKPICNLQGKLVVAGTNQPIAGARVSISYGRMNQSKTCFTDSEGQFAAKVLPGKGTVHVISFFGTGIRPEIHPRIQIEVPEQNEFEIPDIKVVEKETDEWRCCTQRKKASRLGLPTVLFDVCLRK